MSNSKKVSPQSTAFMHEQPVSYQNTSKPPDETDLNSLPWTAYREGGGEWIFSDLRNPIAQQLRAHLESQRKRVIVGSWNYRLCGPKSDPNALITRNPIHMSEPRAKEGFTSEWSQSEDRNAGATCACCGYSPLKSAHIKDGVILGPVCVEHYPHRRCRSHTGTREQARSKSTDAAGSLKREAIPVDHQHRSGQHGG